VTRNSRLIRTLEAEKGIYQQNAKLWASLETAGLRALREQG